jgi:DNA ligase (NAD+)
MAKGARGFFLIWVMVCGLVFAGVDGESARLEWLRAEVARHDELYFKKASPEITDAEYDALKRELRVLEKNAPGRAGDDRSGTFATYRHREPMLGLAKVYTEGELRRFIDGAERTLRIEALTWVVEPKFDGLAISVTYEERKLVRAITRGNGEEGDDVTVNFLTIAGVPRELPAGAPEVVEVRGEIFIDFAEFARINAERIESGEEPFAHPRNLAAGTLKTIDAEEVVKRRLSIMFYNLGAWDNDARPPETQAGLHG